MAYFARKLSRLATYGVCVCDKVRFDFKMSQTPSVTLLVTPPSRGRCFDSFIVNEKPMSNRCFLMYAISLTVYRKPRLPCVKGAVSAAD